MSVRSFNRPTRRPKKRDPLGSPWLLLLFVNLNPEGRLEGLVERFPAGAVRDALHPDGREEAGGGLANQHGVGEVHLALALGGEAKSHATGEDFHVVERLRGHVCVGCVGWVSFDSMTLTHLSPTPRKFVAQFYAPSDLSPWSRKKRPRGVSVLLTLPR